MARYTGPSCRLCRREGQKLFLKGERCYGSKCAMERRSYAPGQHGQNRKKASNYGLQLREKQKAKRFYGLQETQFRNYFEKAAAKKGITGDNLLIMLETRMDNTVFRMGFASSRKEARQLVMHGHFTLNGKRIDIPSIRLSAGDVLEVRPKSKKNTYFASLNGEAQTLSWMKSDLKNMKVEITGTPKREEAEVGINEQLIVEYYSR